MKIALGPWVSPGAKENRLYSEREVEALISKSTDEKDKEALKEIINSLRPPRLL